MFAVVRLEIAGRTRGSVDWRLGVVGSGQWVVERGLWSLGPGDRVWSPGEGGEIRVGSVAPGTDCSGPPWA